MPRYFFHRLDGGYDPDEEGTVCPDLPAARLEAILYAVSTVRDHPEHVWIGGELSVEVTDEAGVIVTTAIVSAHDAPLLNDILKSPPHARR